MSKLKQFIRRAFASVFELIFCFGVMLLIIVIPIVVSNFVVAVLLEGFIVLLLPILIIIKSKNQ